jgi:hypothetical protein
MAVATIYRLAEETKRILDGGDPPTASNVSFNEIKIAIGQVANSLLRLDYLQTNAAVGEKIPNGAMLGWYENISVESWNGKSRCSLPIKPIKLFRNMGVWAVYPKYTTNGNYELDKEFIPLQMGQGALLKSQPMINDILGQTGYEVFGGEAIFTKDIKSVWPDIKIAMRLVVMDISKYDDYEILPITPEIEWEIKKQVVAMYKDGPIPDKIVDSTNKERKNTPINQQTQ